MNVNSQRKERILELHKQGYTQKQICDITGYNRSTISYYCGIRYLNECEARMKKEKEREKLVCDAVPLCKNIHQICVFIGVRPITNNQRIIKSIINKYSLDTSHFTQHTDKSNHRSGIPYSLDQIFCEHSTYTTSSRLKTILLKNHIKEHVCESCHNTEWLGQPIPLQAHHINGIHDDNRLSNIQLLCPNCHSTTDNYCGKNKSVSSYGETQQRNTSLSICPVCGNQFVNNGTNKYCSYKCYLTDKKSTTYTKYKRNVTKDVLIDLFVKGGNFSSIAKLYDVSDNTIRKWCKSFDIPSNRTDLKKYIQTMTP